MADLQETTREALHEAMQAERDRLAQFYLVKALCLEIAALREARNPASTVTDNPAAQSVGKE